MTPQTRQWVGIGLALIGTTCFSAKSILVKLAYHETIDSVTLLSLRMIFSMPFYIIIFAWQFRKVNFGTFTLKEHLGVASLGVLGYYGSSLLDFKSLQYISATLERLVLFIYPTLVILFSAWFFRKTVSRRQMYAVLISYAGIMVSILPDFSFQNKDLLLGVGLVGMAAVFFALYLAGAEGFIKRLGSSLYTSYAMFWAFLAIITHFLIEQPIPISEIKPEAYELGLLLALISTVVPTLLMAKSIDLMGSGNSATVASFSPIATSILAYFFIGEVITIAEMLGMLIVILGVSLIAKKKKT